MPNVVYIECSPIIFVCCFIIFWTNDEMEHHKKQYGKLHLQKRKTLPTADHNLILSRKYFNLWKVIVQYKIRNKQLVEKEKLFEEKIISFISHLRISSHDILSLQNPFNSTEDLFDASTKIKKGLCTEIYQNRFKAQKSIINDQKALIAEQNDIINKLKTEASSTDEINLTIRYQEEFNTLDKTAEKTKSLTKPVEHPLVRRMKEREEGRKTRWSLLELRRKEKEKFLAEKLQQEEEERKRLEEQKRKIRIQEKREKERMMKEMEIKKQREQEMCAVLTVKANSFYKTLLCFKTLQKWKGHMKYLEYIQSKCSYLYELSTLRNCLQNWKNEVVSRKELMHDLASRFEKSYTLTIGWYQWKLKINEIRRRGREISTWYDKEITRNTFKKWLCATYKISNNKQLLLQSIGIIYDRILILKTFGSWKQLPRVLYLEREKEKRLREWESRVKSILPDYSMQLF